jgi:hypothetical protein
MLLCSWVGSVADSSSILSFGFQSIDVLANMRGVETLYLHVDVTNEGALSLYERAGYKRANGSEMFLEFTCKLNLHDGATKGRNHFLLYKDLVARPTWLPISTLPATAQKSSIPGPVFTAKCLLPPKGTLGLEVPC